MTSPNASWPTRATTMGWMAVFAIVGALPYAFAWLTVPADLAYTGLMFNVPDHAQYWSWITASRHGLFISNTMSPEPNPPTFMQPLMWCWAQVQAATGMSFAAIMQAWRLVAIGLVVSATAAFVRTFLADDATRKSAAVMILVGAGVGWMLVIVKFALGLADVPFPHDIFTAEPNTFFGMFAYPYLPMAQGLVVFTLVGVWRAHVRRAWLPAVMAAVCALALALSHAYDLLPIYATIAVTWCWIVVRDRQLPVAFTGAAALVAIASAPVAFFYRQLTTDDPMWREILAQYPNAGVWTPPHLHLVVLMGLPLVLALVTLAGRRLRDDGQRFLVAWFVSGLVLMYVPTVYQIKMLTGWQFPVAALAALAWQAHVAPRVSGWAQRFGRLGAVAPVALLVLLVVPTNLYLFAWRLVELRRHERPYFMPRTDLAALEWLGANATKDDVVLAPLELGQFVPNLGQSRAVVAHWAMTVRYFERRDAAARFFARDTPGEEREALLAREGVTLVVRPDGAAWRDGFDPSQHAGYEQVFSDGATSIHRVRARGVTGGER